MKSAVNQTIFRIKPYVPGKPIEEVKRELGLKNVIKLASNENPYGPSPKALAAVLKASQNLNRYPDGECYYLRSELAKRLKVSAGQLIFGNGSDELIVFAVRAFVSPKDEVVIAVPSFLIYEMASKVAGANIKAIPLRKDFCYDLEGMKKAVTSRTKIIFLGNPDNPSGSYLTQRQVENFLRGLRKDILVFLDEAYFEYVHADDYVDSIGLIKKYKNVFVTRTFSKMYGLAGLRIGYGIGSAEVVGYLNSVREPFNVNSLAQAAALACLKDQSYYQQLSQRIEKQRQYLYEKFRFLGLDYIASCTNFILIKLRRDSREVSQALLRMGVIVRDMKAWGLSDYIRITIGTEKENQRLVKSLEEIL